MANVTRYNRRASYGKELAAWGLMFASFRANVKSQAAMK